MKSLKSVLLLVILALMATALVACASGESPEWTITITGADKAEFTSIDHSRLDTVTIEANLKGEKQSWEGVLLKDVLDALGVKDYTSVTLEGSDGYTVDYTPDTVNDPMTILGTRVNGEALGEQNGYVQSVAASQTPNTWVRNLVRITVNE